MSVSSGMIYMLTQLDDAYHNKSQPLVSDKAYDDLRKMVRGILPKHPYFKGVGAPVPKGVKAGSKKEVTLEKIMPSLHKLRPSEVVTWLASLGRGQYFFSPKMDGISIDITYDQGKLILATTRGNGSVGQDVTAHIKLSKIPKVIATKQRVIVSGELIIKKTLFNSKYSKKVQGKYKTCRNFVGGMLNSLIDANIKACMSDIDYIVFGVFSNIINWNIKTNELAWAKSQGFKTVADLKLDWLYNQTAPLKGNAIVDLEKQIKARIVKPPAKVDYEMDGLVVEVLSKDAKKNLGKLNDFYPAWARAIKLNVEDQTHLVGTIDKIVSEMSIRRRYAPVAILKDELDFNGASVNRASVYNYKAVKELGLAPGAKVKLIRSGDVIPRILSCSTPGKVIMPKVCDWCRSKLQWTKTQTDLYCPNVACSGLHYLRMQHFISCMGIDGISGGTVKTIWDYMGQFTLPQLLKFSIKDLANANGIGTITAKILVNGLKEKLNGVTQAYLMYASGLFCDENTGLAHERLSAIVETLDGNLDLKPAVMRAKLIKTHGIGKVITDLFINNLIAYKAWLKQISPFVKIAKAIKPIRGPLTGKQFAFTNFRDYELIAKIEAAGGKVDGVKKTTTALFFAGSSTKVAQAQNWDIPCIPQSKCNDYIAKLLTTK